MSIGYVKEEVYYYTGFVPTSEEIEEIIFFCKLNPRSCISEVISDYYGC